MLGIRESSSVGPSCLMRWVGCLVIVVEICGVGVGFGYEKAALVVCDLARNGIQIQIAVRSCKQSLAYCCVSRRKLLWISIFHVY